MFRYLPGIILVQVVTLALLWVNADSTINELLTRVALPALLLSTVTALWFAAVSRAEAQREKSTLQEKYYQEREELARSMERTRADVMQQASSEREQLVQQTHREMIKAERRASRSANMKVGAAFTLVTVAGVGLLFHPVHDPGAIDDHRCQRCTGRLLAAMETDPACDTAGRGGGIAGRQIQRKFARTGQTHGIG